ncbi:hypothetical protein IAQ61_008717 [Plenodomus lingam]|uniref:Predicted protein n=1 Tax=Leptosphaeria maculans (strain JN3 / isolate v23.1.3 / race Av1-4-5-6-7-8) TaxID=985895 RepID=E4ZNC5_LEPMJ|nr:predicted protein [Plenodomus lingam JN3]KAH9864772.1 hypothetical protein IAQ61_008717 [Plenodomus lingam]CBX92984.1 predicted protein [Plenodomus lingam JN3]
MIEEVAGVQTAGSSGTVELPDVLRADRSGAATLIERDGLHRGGGDMETATPIVQLAGLETISAWINLVGVGVSMGRKASGECRCRCSHLDGTERLVLRRRFPIVE